LILSVVFDASFYVVGSVSNITNCKRRKMGLNANPIIITPIHLNVGVTHILLHLRFNHYPSLHIQNKTVNTSIL